MLFVARSGDFIDLAGFTGLIDEKMIWQSIANSGIEYKEWAMRKESIDGEPVLHLYIEVTKPVKAEEVRKRVHRVDEVDKSLLRGL